MFDIKKIEKKKLIAYIAVITVIFAAIGFLVYKNHSLTDQNKPLESNNVSVVKKEALEIKNIKSGHILDDDIFNNPKFKALRNNSIIKTSKINIGRDNPFKPY